jgi:hypothetical protein
MTLLAKCTLRLDGHKRDKIDFTLPLKRVWFQGTRSDLHLQFEGLEDDNICPHMNECLYGDEFLIPAGARLFARWLLDTIGIPWTKDISICSVIIEEGDRTKITPPPEVIKDLVGHWDSPNH